MKPSRHKDTRKMRVNEKCKIENLKFKVGKKMVGRGAP